MSPGSAFWSRKVGSQDLPPPTDQPLPPQLESVRDQLIIENLKPGKYRLVDKRARCHRDGSRLGQGVAIDSSPAHKRLPRPISAVVNNKNLQFTYSWKALNQVHIVGERRRSPSGKSVAKGSHRVQQLANERDKALRKGMELKDTAMANQSRIFTSNVPIDKQTSRNS